MCGFPHWLSVKTGPTVYHRSDFWILSKRLFAKVIVGNQLLKRIYLFSLNSIMSHTRLNFVVLLLNV